MALSVRGVPVRRHMAEGAAMDGAAAGREGKPAEEHEEGHKGYQVRPGSTAGGGSGAGSSCEAESKHAGDGRIYPKSCGQRQTNLSALR